MALERSWISGVVNRFVEMVLASRDDTPSTALTPSVETVAVLATMLEPIMVENVNCAPTVRVEPTMVEYPNSALTFNVLNVAVLATILEPIIVENVRFVPMFIVENVTVEAVMVETVNVLITVSRKAMSFV
jgi:hypothetical protein